MSRQKNRGGWTPLRPATAAAAIVRRVKRELGLSDDDLRLGGLYVNDRYQVMVRRVPLSGPGPDLVHLSIKRHDLCPVHD